MGKLLYLGCGNHRMAGFTHVELNLSKDQRGAPDVVADIADHIPLPDGCADLVFSRGTLEHLTFNELINCLLETNRLLRAGGAVRMLVPDLDIMVRDYLDRKYEKIGWDDPNTPNENYVDYFIARLLYHDHYYLHNFDTLSRVLAKTGFENIQEAKPGESIIAEARGELLKAETGRLNQEILIEAIKSDRPPTAQRWERPWPRSPHRRWLARVLNVDIRPYVRRRAMFPSSKWFRERKLLRQQRRRHV